MVFTKFIELAPRNGVGRDLGISLGRTRRTYKQIVSRFGIRLSPSQLHT